MIAEVERMKAVWRRSGLSRNAWAQLLHLDHTMMGRWFDGQSIPRKYNIARYWDAVYRLDHEETP